MAPGHGPPLVLAAAAVLESRFGGGSRRIRSFPGNLRVVRDYPAESVVIRRADYSAALADDVSGEQLVAWLTAQGREVIYTPETMTAAPPAPLFAPHIESTVNHARARGAAARETGGGSISWATLLSLAPAACAALGTAALASGSRRSGARLIAAYAAVLAGTSAAAAVRFRSRRVGLLTTPGLVATHAAYVAGFTSGLLRGR